MRRRELKVAATTAWALVKVPADWHLRKVTEQERAHTTMTDEQDIASGIRLQAVANFPDDSRLRGFRCFPAPHTLLGTGEELICNGLKFIRRKITGGVAIILMHRLSYHQFAPKSFRQWYGSFERLRLSATDHMPGARKPIRCGKGGHPLMPAFVE